MVKFLREFYKINTTHSVIPKLHSHAFIRLPLNINVLPKFLSCSQPKRNLILFHDASKENMRNEWLGRSAIVFSYFPKYERSY